MSNIVEMTIVAQSEEEFDELCERIESLAGVGVKVTLGSAAQQLVLLHNFDANDETNTITLRFDAIALKYFQLPLGAREALDSVEKLVLH
jgi:hypothetical protein